MSDADIDLDPGQAASAARRTVATEQDWQAWAHTSRTAMQGLADSSTDATVKQAFSAYLETNRRLLDALPARAREQGVELGDAVQTAIDADAQSEADLTPAQESGRDSERLVTRPINAE